MPASELISLKMSKFPSHIRPFTMSTQARWGALVLFVIFAWALSRIDISWARFLLGTENAAKFVGRMFPPIFNPREELIKGMWETVQIAILASALGLMLSLPVGLLAARNLMPAWVTWPVRLFITLCRTFHPVIVAIIFVKAVGFGALAGILALTVASIGFLGKLFTEAIEEISMKQIEAVRATGASFANVLTFAVVPQVIYRFIGFIAYEVDSNLRNSTMVGIVGAGGIGGTLFAAFQRFDYDFVLGIVICIIALIMLGEVLQIAVKKVFKQ
jgi:phosphonate transport system permease protein